MEMTANCPKCGYVRKPADIAPNYECPRCGIVYAKYDAERDFGRKRQRDNLSIKDKVTNSFLKNGRQKSSIVNKIRANIPLTILLVIIFIGVSIRLYNFFELYRGYRMIVIPLKKMNLL